MLQAFRTTVRAIEHEDRLTTVGHLDELRMRLIASLAVLLAAFGICFWKNHLLLRIIDRPLARQTDAQVRAGHGPLGATYGVARSTEDVAVQVRALARLLGASKVALAPSGRAALGHVERRLDHDISRLSVPPPADKPVTLGIGEPFATTVTVSLVCALILALPFLLYQAYAFLLPALSPAERRAVMPMAVSVPFLFAAGVLFGYVVVLPAAVHFFQNFNSSEFNVLVQASQYYKFVATTLLAMGLLFQVPVGILAVTRAGLISPRQLRKKRRYAVLACGVVAALLPGDAFTLLLETVPLYLLFELGVFLASVAERRSQARARVRAIDADYGLGPSGE